MLFKPIWCRIPCNICCNRWRAGCSPTKGTLKECRHFLPQSLLSSIPPSSISLSSGLASGLSSQVSLILIIFFINFIFWFSLSLSLNAYLSLWLRAYSLPLYISPCLTLGPCIALLCPSVYTSMHVSVCLSVRPGCPMAEESARTLTSCVAGAPESVPA